MVVKAREIGEVANRRHVARLAEVSQRKLQVAAGHGSVLAPQPVQVNAAGLDRRRTDRDDLRGCVRVVGELDAIAAAADRAE
jgi:hypothetical protein